MWIRRLMLAVSFLVSGIGQAMAGDAKPEEVEKAKAAMPAKAPATPEKARKLLIFTGSKGFYHDSIPLGAEVIKLLGEKSGAYTAVITNDAGVFKADSLKEFDAVFLDNTTGNLFDGDEMKEALIDFVKSGKGIAGNHGATDCFHGWKDFGDMIGGYFHEHPFRRISVKLDDPKNPINAAFGGKGFVVSDEIYTFKEPYSRDKLHILLSLDWENTHAKKGNRSDNDYALSWIREYGNGRVFYTAFGHDHEIFWNKPILEHMLAGIQYALGDLKADAMPTARMNPAVESVRGPDLEAK